MSNTKYLLEYMKKKVEQCEFNLRKERDLLVEYQNTVESLEKKMDIEKANDLGFAKCGVDE